MSLGSAIPKPLRALQGLRLGDPHYLWSQSHLSRRAGVLLLLSPMPRSPNELEVLLTVRSQQLSYAGDAALPGGKADSLEETPWDVAVREAKEEVGLDAAQFEHIKTLPGYISSRLLTVVPSVAWAPQPVVSRIASKDEVAKLFRAPLRRFLSADRVTQAEIPEGTVKLHHFDILAAQKRIGDPKYDRVWGLTANILVDCARLAYGEDPNFDFYRGNAKVVGAGTPIGNMEMLESMLDRGVLQNPVPKRRRS